MAYLGFDDTDSRRGLCTTYLATELVRALDDLDLLGLPRLVRLNPNVPWKTRGNGALALRFGRGRGPPSVVGEIGGRRVLAYARGTPARVDDALESRVRETFEPLCALDDPSTQPGYALLHRRPAPGLYWRAVRGFVTVPQALRAARGCGRVRGYAGGRGRIGALAALSWRPRDRTYEVLAYRRPDRWGSPREVDPASVIEMDRRFPSTFNNYDRDEGRVTLAPRSPCPVLVGIRGDDPLDLPRALASLRTEPPDRWLLFETNQGTDDHLGPWSPRARPGSSVYVRGRVSDGPRILRGGHVVFSLRPGSRDAVDCTVYEPAKRLRRVARSLRPGDDVCVVGALRAAPRTINVEKMAVMDLAPGRPRAIARGWYEPPVSARRHIAKPLKRAGGAYVPFPSRT